MPHDGSRRIRVPGYYCKSGGVTVLETSNPKVLAQQAMQDAFADYGDADRVIYNTFEKNIAEIVPKDKLSTVALAIVKWTTIENNFEAFVRGLYNEFPNVASVRVLFQRMFPNDPR